MSGPGRVVLVDAGTVPNTNDAARLVLVDRPTGERILFYLPIGDDPPIGGTIDWSAGHAWWPGHRVRKLSNEIDPGAPLR